MSTYSPSLRIELIGTGSQAGSWGDTTNGNLAYVLDSAIAGSVTVTANASKYVLTYLNGPSNNSALNQSVQAILKLATSTGADFEIYAPPVSKQYTLKNTSGYNATIYNSSSIGNTTAAGTGVVIPAGATMTVWSDGTNFTQQNTYLTSPTLTGTPVAPTATYGTNTTQISTTAFVQSALQALYPVGTVYTNAGNGTNPATLFGFGTWVALGAGRVLIGAGGGYTAGSTGGSADAIVVSHSHTASSGTESANHTHSGTTGAMNSNASHSHSIGYTGNLFYSGGGGNPSTFWGAGSNQGTNATNTDHTHNFSTGTESAAHNHAITVDSAGSSGAGANLQPYLVVYMWQRTA